MVQCVCLSVCLSQVWHVDTYVDCSSICLSVSCRLPFELVLMCSLPHELSLCYSLDHIVAMVCPSYGVLILMWTICLSVTGCRLRQSSCAVYHANHVCVSRLLVSASFSLRRHRRVKQVSASTCHWAGSQRSSITNSCM